MVEDASATVKKDFTEIDKNLAYDWLHVNIKI